MPVRTVAGEKLIIGARMVGSEGDGSVISGGDGAVNAGVLPRCGVGVTATARLESGCVVVGVVLGSRLVEGLDIWVVVTSVVGSMSVVLLARHGILVGSGVGVDVMLT